MAPPTARVLYGDDERPTILVGTRSDEASFEERLRDKNTHEALLNYDFNRSDSERSATTG